MEASIKQIIINTNELYINLSKVEQDEFIKQTNLRLEQHNQAIENIGIGYQTNKVQAANIYLRYLRRYQQ